MTWTEVTLNGIFSLVLYSWTPHSPSCLKAVISITIRWNYQIIGWITNYTTLLLPSFANYNLQDSRDYNYHETHSKTGLCRSSRVCQRSLSSRDWWVMVCYNGQDGQTGQSPSLPAVSPLPDTGLLHWVPGGSTGPILRHEEWKFRPSWPWPWHIPDT